MEYILFILVGLLAGGASGAFWMSQSQKKAGRAAEDVLFQAKKEAETVKASLLKEAKDEVQMMKDQAKREEMEQQQRLQKLEERLMQKEELVTEKYEKLDTAKSQVEEKLNELRLKEEAVVKLEQEGKSMLEKISGLSKDVAKETLLKKYENEFEQDIIAHVRKVEERAVDEADKKAKKIIAAAIQKLASEVASESMASIVQLPDDDLKGRIIGREGRNITTFELLTGVDVIVDDTPGSIIISGFDLMRRYIAKKSLEILIEDGRIHPARIEEVVEKVKADTNDLLKEFGEKAVMELGFTGLHPDLIRIIGRLRFRTSYGQNILKHSMEVAYINAQLAQELGADVKLAKMAGFFHDLGKAMTHEIEGSHALIGGQILRKFQMDERLINCVESHHNDVEPVCVEAILTAAADAISGARPGARSDTAEQYIKRLQDLENVAASFEGVKSVYAIQAGREIRVIVDPEEISDLESLTLAQHIARKVEAELQYPGEIKVSLIRERRVVEFAR